MAAYSLCGNEVAEVEVTCVSPGRPSESKSPSPQLVRPKMKSGLGTASTCYKPLTLPSQHTSSFNPQIFTESRPRAGQGPPPRCLLYKGLHGPPLPFPQSLFPKHSVVPWPQGHIQTLVAAMASCLSCLSDTHSFLDIQDARDGIL